jgi:hypothetical protein
MGLAACAGSGSIPDPTAKHVEYAERGGYPATLPSLKNGRRLYVNRCSGCHNLYKPSAYPPGDWPRIVLDMQGNAELNEVQLVDITRYLVAMSLAAREPSPAAPASPSPSAPAANPAANAVPAPDAPPASEGADSAGIAPATAP